MRLPKPASDGGSPRSAVVVVHGFKGFRRWAFFPDISARLAAAGHAVVTLDFSRNGFGEDPEGLMDDPEGFAQNTLTRELDELARVLAALRAGEVIQADSGSPVPPERVGLLGHSRGGGIALLAAAECGVQSLVTWNAVSDFDRWPADTKATWRRDGRIHVVNARTGEQMPMNVSLLEDFEANRARLDVTAAAGQFSIPWLIVHAADDAAVRPDEARKLARANPDATLHWVEGAGHTFEVKHPFTHPAPAAYEGVVVRTLAHFERLL